MNIHIKTLIALAGIMLGVVIGEKTEYGSEVAVTCLVLGVMQLVICFFERRNEKKRVVYGEVTTHKKVTRFSIPLASGIFCVAVFVMILRTQFDTHKNNFVCEKLCTFNATIISTPTIKNEYQIFSVRPDSEGDVYDVQIKTPLYPRYTVGEHLVLQGKVSLPYTAMPHDGKKSFDYETYLRTRSIGSEMLYPKIIVATSSSHIVTFVTKLAHLREYFVTSIGSYVSEPSASLASGMLFGATSMSKELVQTFRTSGISHIVVLSGFNIAILISFVLLMLMFVPLFLRVLCASIFVILFVLMVGAEASIVRATLMSFVALLALMIGRGYVARQALLLSLIAIIFYEPLYILHDASLHLSFLATAGIVYMSDGVKNMLHAIRSRTYKEIITTTLCAYLATLPYVMYTFGTVSVYALLTNLLVLPLVPIMMLLTALVVVVTPLSHLVALLLGYITTTLGDFIVYMARMVEKLPLATFTVSLSFIKMCMLYILLIVVYAYLVRFLERKKNETTFTNSDEIVSEIISYH